MSEYEFQYQHFNNSSPFYGILDPSQENSIISLNRLRKHQNDITKYPIKHLTKTSYEQQYHDLEYDNIEGLLIDFHILIGIEKMDISLKKVLVVKEIEGEKDDERFGFRLGSDFLKEFDAEVEDVNGKNLLHRLKFTVQLKKIKGSKDNSNVSEPLTNANKKQSNIIMMKDFFDFNKYFARSHFYIMIAFVVSLSIFVIFKTVNTQPPIFEDKIKFLVTLENEINSFDLSLKELKQSEKSIIQLTRNSTSILQSDIRILKNCLGVQQITTKLRVSYENSLDYYGNTLWKLKELNIEKVPTTSSLGGRLFSFFVHRREDRINESEFSTYHSLLNRFLTKFSNNADFFQEIEMAETTLDQLQNQIDDFKKQLKTDLKVNDVSKYFDVISTIVSDNLKYFQNIKSNLEKLKENNIVIGYFFMKLKEDFKRILEYKDFNNYEIDQINHYLHVIKCSRRKFLKDARISAK